jgi:hypothetical protein
LAVIFGGWKLGTFLNEFKIIRDIVDTSLRPFLDTWLLVTGNRPEAELSQRGALDRNISQLEGRRDRGEISGQDFEKRRARMEAAFAEQERRKSIESGSATGATILNQERYLKRISNNTGGTEANTGNVQPATIGG